MNDEADKYKQWKVCCIYSTVTHTSNALSLEKYRARRRGGGASKNWEKDDSCIVSFKQQNKCHRPLARGSREQMALSSEQQIHRELKSNPPGHPSGLHVTSAFPHPGDELSEDNNGLLCSLDFFLAASSWLLSQAQPLSKQLPGGYTDYRDISSQSSFMSTKTGH